MQKTLKAIRHVCWFALFGTAGLSVMLGACSGEGNGDFTDDPTATNSKTSQLTPRKAYRYEAKVVKKQSVLSLSANATAFSIHLTGCVSSLDTTITQQQSYLEVYEFDRNCLAKLTSFEINQQTYQPKPGSDFDDWQVNDEAVFVNTNDAGDELKVKVLKTISNPVVANGEILYRFSDVTQAAGETVDEVIVRESASVTVNGNASPKFKINKVQLVDITAQGNGEFRFHLECDGQAMVSTASGYRCYDSLLSEITILLVENTVNRALTLAELDNFFSAPQFSPKYIDAAEVFGPNVALPQNLQSAGYTAAANGGFVTGAHGDSDVMVLPGVKPIASHPDMFLILKVTDSYQYFPITLVPIVQNGQN